jgi:hypothetical protein
VPRDGSACAASASSHPPAPTMGRTRVEHKRIVRRRRLREHALISDVAQPKKKTTAGASAARQSHPRMPATATQPRAGPVTRGMQQALAAATAPAQTETPVKSAPAA